MNVNGREIGGHIRFMQIKHLHRVDLSGLLMSFLTTLLKFTVVEKKNCCNLFEVKPYFSWTSIYYILLLLLTLPM